VEGLEQKLFPGCAVRKMSLNFPLSWVAYCCEIRWHFWHEMFRKLFQKGFWIFKKFHDFFKHFIYGSEIFFHRASPVVGVHSNMKVWHWQRKV